MKYLILFGVTIAAYFFTSCKKDILPGEDTAGILGKWNIVSDSFSRGIAANNHMVVYTGRQDDYFNFSSNGKLYIKENGALDTLDYNLISDTTILIDSFLEDSNGSAQTCTITSLTSRTAIITTAIILTPGGTFGRKVTLEK